MSSSGDPERRPIVPARQARGGRDGAQRSVRAGLSIASVIIVFAIIWLIYFA
jgi:hypothetical protein